MKLKPIATARRQAREQDEELSAATAEVPASDVRGLVDNATTDRLFGWAWDAAYPGRRLKVELRLAGEVMANTIADFVRPDLAKNGVGDGCHAFEFPLTPDWYERRTDLTIVAFGVDGTEFPIAMRVRRPDDTQVTGQLQRMIENVMTDQQQIRAEFATLREQAAQLPRLAEVQAIDTAQQELNRKVENLEVWMTRLDARLGEAALAEGGAGGRGDPWITTMIAVLASAATGALALAVAYYLS
jgi:hypothetical protein